MVEHGKWDNKGMLLVGAWYLGQQNMTWYSDATMGQQQARCCKHNGAA